MVKSTELIAEPAVLALKSGKGQSSRLFHLGFHNFSIDSSLNFDSTFSCLTD